MIISLTNLSVKQLKHAVVLREKIDALERELAALVGGPQTPGVNGHGGRRTMSAAARAKIGAAQKLRWAKQRKSGKAGKTGKVKRKLSAAGRARIVAALKARWAKVKGAK